jgi:hypothetical protein
MLSAPTIAARFQFEAGIPMLRIGKLLAAGEKSALP